jgi:hypothetical protein
MESISYANFIDKISDIDVDDSEIAKYLTGDSANGTPFGPSLIPDPKKVVPTNELEGLQVQAAVAGSLVNHYARIRRQKIFDSRLDETDVPALYAEGDSWLQFPFLLKDIVDQLSPDYRIWCTSKAGDTLKDMVFQKPEYLKELHRLYSDKKVRVKAFLFSGAGNDIVGKGSDGDPALKKMVKPYDSSKSIEWHIETEAGIDVFADIEKAYRKVLSDIDKEFPESKYPDLKVILHGYDHVPTRSVPSGDSKRPKYARNWTGEPLTELGFPDNETASKVVAGLIKRLNELTARVCGAYSRAYHVDLQGTVPVDQWNDELHPTNSGYKKAAAKIKQFIEKNP